jgi:hypothetical protein
MTKCCQRLAQREQMLAPIISHQRLGDGIRAGLDPPIAECSQHMRVALTRQNGQVADGKNPQVVILWPLQGKA